MGMIGSLTLWVFICTIFTDEHDNSGAASASRRSSYRRSRKTRSTRRIRRSFRRSIRRSRRAAGYSGSTHGHGDHSSSSSGSTDSKHHDDKQPSVASVPAQHTMPAQQPVNNHMGYNAPTYGQFGFNNQPVFGSTWLKPNKKDAKLLKDNDKADASMLADSEEASTVADNNKAMAAQKKTIRKIMKKS